METIASRQYAWLFVADVDGEREFYFIFSLNYRHRGTNG